MKPALTSWLTLVLLVALSTPASAQEWVWEEDATFLNPNLSPELLTLEGYYSAGGLYDFSGDGDPEYVIVCAGRSNYLLYLATSEGDFPRLHWRLQRDFFPALEVDRNILLHSVSFYDLDDDGAVEIIFNSNIILKNRGDFEHPDWTRADELFPDVQHEQGTPHFCDWDGDGLQDLIFTYDNGFFRFERNEEGEWAGLGFTACYDSVWGYSTHLADLDKDGDADIIGLFDMPCMWTATLAFLNEGTPEAPQWSEAIELYPLVRENPCIYDLNGDGFPDLIDGWKYLLHTGEQGVAEWNYPTAWGGVGGYAFADFTGDGSIDNLSGYSYGSFTGHLFRLVQRELTPGGWAETRFFGSDCGDWASGFTDVWGMAVGDFLLDGTTQIALAKSVGMNVNDASLTLYRDVAEGEAWAWRPVEGFFSGVLDTVSYWFETAFGDFDADGDLDLAMISGNDNGYGVVYFYEAYWCDSKLSWLSKPEWRIELFDTLLVQSAGAGDMDGDGRCDLLLTTYNQGSPGQLLLFRNLEGFQNGPAWRWERHAFEAAGPQTASSILVTDINSDRKPDIIAGSVWINNSTTSVRDNVILPAGFTASISPNPTNGAVEVMFHSDRPGETHIGLFDASGRLVLARNLGLTTAGDNRLHLPVGNLPSGDYQVHLRCGANERIMTLVLTK